MPDRGEEARALTRDMVGKLRDELIRNGQVHEAEQLEAAERRMLGPPALPKLASEYADGLREIAKMVGADVNSPDFHPLDAVVAVRTFVASRNADGGAIQARTCEVESCEASAAAFVHWPGKSVWLCRPHVERAQHMAGAMGFRLSTTSATDQPGV